MGAMKLTATAGKEFNLGDLQVLIPKGFKWKNKKITEIFMTEEFLEDFATTYPTTVENNTISFDIKTGG